LTTRAEGADLRARLQDVRHRMAGAAARSGRDVREITLVAVTKTVPVGRIVAAYQLGLRDFGENRVQEARDKIPVVNKQVLPQQSHGTGEGLHWHMIGHLQRNKVRHAIALFDIIHSVDSVRLAGEISRRCQARSITMPILLEVNVSGEASKYGFVPGDIEPAVADILTLPSLVLQGLMTIAPIVAVPDDARPSFERLRKLRDRLADRFPEVDWLHLSMGMTDDFEVAIEEGATLVRVGRAIFGER